MRSTITLYFAGSPMRVPPSFTNSAATPSFFPSSFTRTMNAGGKLYSRPQRSPTFFICVLLSGNDWIARSASASIHCVCGRSARLGHARPRLCNQMPYHGFQIARFPVNSQLPVRARAFFQDGVHVLHGAAATKVVDHVVHQFEQLRN